MGEQMPLLYPRGPGGLISIPQGEKHNDPVHPQCSHLSQSPPGNPVVLVVLS